MALDEPKENDEIFEIDGFKYLVNKDFNEKVQPIKVDFTEMGFKLDCAVSFNSGCSSCGSGNGDACEI